MYFSGTTYIRNTCRVIITCCFSSPYGQLFPISKMSVHLLYWPNASAVLPLPEILIRVFCEINFFVCEMRQFHPYKILIKNVRSKFTKTKFVSKKSRICGHRSFTNKGCKVKKSYASIFIHYTVIFINFLLYCTR
jgi:hypothetical protein